MTEIYKLLIAVILVFVAHLAGLSAQTDKSITDNQIIIYTGVNDKHGKSVAGLKQENFKLYEEKKEKSITYFSDTNEPASIGFVIDTSGSMVFKRPLPFAKMISGLTRSADSENEYFALTFSNSANVTNFTKDSRSLLRGLEQLTAPVPKGNTRFFDAARLALESMNSAKYRKRAVIIISDLGDNDSKTNFDQLKWLVRESNVILYVIGVNYEDYRKLGIYSRGNRFLELVPISGGSAFFPVDTREMEECLERIGLDLQHRYAIGFEPSLSEEKDQDEWRTIKVKIEPSKTEKGKLLVATRDGYYASRKK